MSKNKSCPNELKKKLLDKHMSSHYLQNRSIFTNKKSFIPKKNMRHVSIRDFKKQKIKNSMLNRDSTQNLSALKISNVQYS